LLAEWHAEQREWDRRCFLLLQTQCTKEIDPGELFYRLRTADHNEEEATANDMLNFQAVTAALTPYRGQ